MYAETRWRWERDGGGQVATQEYIQSYYKRSCVPLAKRAAARRNSESTAPATRLSAAQVDPPHESVGESGLRRGIPAATASNNIYNQAISFYRRIAASSRCRIVRPTCTRFRRTFMLRCCSWQKRQSEPRLQDHPLCQLGQGLQPAGCNTDPGEGGAGRAVMSLAREGKKPEGNTTTSAAVSSWSGVLKSVELCAPEGHPQASISSITGAIMSRISSGRPSISQRGPDVSDVQRLGYVTLKKLRALSRIQSAMAGCSMAKSATQFRSLKMVRRVLGCLASSGEMTTEQQTP